MSTLRPHHLHLLLILGPSAWACGSEPPPTPPGPTLSLFPLAVGNTWTFRVTEADGTTKTKTQSVVRTATTTLGDGFLLKTLRDDNDVRSLQVRDAAGKVYRTAEETYVAGTLRERLVFVPGSLRVDTAITSAGATYQSTTEERSLDLVTGAVVATVSKTQNFVIEASEESVTVPAGTFRAVRVRRDTVGTVQKTFWYVFGVGKVKETGGQTEELMSYTVEETTQ